MSTISNIFMPIQATGSSGALSQTPPSTSPAEVSDSIVSKAALKFLKTDSSTDPTFVIDGEILTPPKVASTLRRSPGTHDLQALAENTLGMRKSQRSGDLSSLADGSSPLPRSPAGSMDLTRLV
ncbi:MAG: hypothetical protein NTX49_07845 [Chlamydiae bacterium]|nr:hypothetical protein [Chlamydiota bacterium]